MNAKMVRSTLGKVLKIEAALMIFPLGMALLYREDSWGAFAITIAVVCWPVFWQILGSPKTGW